ncbi:Hypothetical protein (plasmid) [Pseudomonas putida]|nr:Hypothetical protein [Pseudomonas putida]
MLLRSRDGVNHEVEGRVAEASARKIVDSSDGSTIVEAGGLGAQSCPSQTRGVSHR